MFAIVEAAVWPVFRYAWPGSQILHTDDPSIIFSEAAAQVIKTDQSTFEIQMWSMGFFLLGVANVIVSFLRCYTANLAGGRLTKLLRSVC